MIAVGVPTYRRPEELRTLLGSLEVSCPPRTKVYVVDNDPAESARGVVADVAATSELSIEYSTEVTPGLVAVRQRLLDIAAAAGSALAFVDDDEVVTPKWYAELLTASSRFPGAILAGPVRYELPEDAPEWSRGAFSRPDHLDGSLLDMTGFGNSLIPAALLQRRDICWIDTAFSNTGGEDTEFMSRMVGLGIEIRWVAGAAVREAVPYSRVTRAWVSARQIRSGEIWAMINVRQRGRSRLYIGAQGLVRIAAASTRIASKLLLLKLPSPEALASVRAGYGWLRVAFHRRRRLRDM